MYSNFKEHAIEYVKQAVQEDDAGNYSKAFPPYMNALDYFRTHSKYEKNLNIKEAITQKCMEYLKRVEEITAILNNEGSGAASGDATIASQPKTKSEGGMGKDEVDPKQAKLRVDIDYVIIREKPNVKRSNVARLESAKLALQKAIILPVKFP